MASPENIALSHSSHIFTRPRYAWLSMELRNNNRTILCLCVCCWWGKDRKNIKKKLHDNKIYDSKTIDREIGIKIYFLSTSGLNENMHLHSLQHRNICQTVLRSKWIFCSLALSLSFCLCLSLLHAPNFFLLSFVLFLLWMYYMRSPNSLPIPFCTQSEGGYEWNVRYILKEKLLLINVAWNNFRSKRNCVHSCRHHHPFASCWHCCCLCDVLQFSLWIFTFGLSISMPIDWQNFSIFVCDYNVENCKFLVLLLVYTLSFDTFARTIHTHTEMNHCTLNIRLRKTWKHYLVRRGCWTILCFFFSSKTISIIVPLFGFRFCWSTQNHLERDKKVAGNRFVE